MKHPYPIFVDDQSVFCQNCRARVTSPFQSSGFPAGEGSMRGQCGECRVITYFDFGEPRPLAFDIGEPGDL